MEIIKFWAFKSIKAAHFKQPGTYLKKLSYYFNFSAFTLLS